MPKTKSVKSTHYSMIKSLLNMKEYHDSKN